MKYNLYSAERKDFLQLENLPDNCILVFIDDVKSIQEICNAYGEQIYTGEYRKINPIFEDSSYFGRNLGALDECLFLAPKAIGKVIIAIHGKNVNLPENEYRAYIDVLKDNSSIVGDLMDFEDRGGFFFCLPEDKVEEDSTTHPKD